VEGPVSLHRHSTIRSDETLSLNQLFTSIGYSAGMDQSEGVQNRRSNRSPVLLSAAIELNGATLPVRLRNLSEEGALIEGDRLPHPGLPVFFERNGLRVRSRIMWVEGGFAGVKFEHPLEPEELLRHVPRPRQKFEPKFRRPGLACGPLAEADRKIVQLWAAPSAFRD
jgi:hypothetical protein